LQGMTKVSDYVGSVRTRKNVGSTQSEASPGWGAHSSSKGEGDWYFSAEQPAPAPRLAHPEGCDALRIVLVTVPRVSRSCVSAVLVPKVTSTSPEVIKFLRYEDFGANQTQSPLPPPASGGGRPSPSDRLTTQYVVLRPIQGLLEIKDTHRPRTLR